MDPKKELVRSVSLFDATLLVAGSMIGSGIFIVSSEMSRTLGSGGYLLLAWLITGVITVFGALSYGELAGMMPNAGGQFVYISKAYNKLVGFLYGWSVFMVIQTGVIAAVAVAFAKFSAVLFPFFGTDNILLNLGSLKISAAQLLAIFSIVVLTYINSRGINTGKLVQRVFTSTKLIALLGLIILGLMIGSNKDAIAANFSHFWDASQITNVNGIWQSIPLSGLALISAMGVAMIGSLFSSDAWNNVTFISAEIKNPKKNIPLSLFFGTLIVTVIYLLANVVYVMAIPVLGDPNGTDVISKGIQFATNDRVGTAAVELILGNTAAYVMAILIMISTFGCNNGLILSGSRVYYAMAKEGLFFKRAEKLNKNQVPGFALVIQCIWASVLCLSGTYGDLLEYCTFTSLLFYIITILGVFILRYKDPNAERPYKVFGYPFVPAFYILIALAISIDLLIFKTTNTGIGLFIVLLGIPIYYFQKYRSTK